MPEIVIRCPQCDRGLKLRDSSKLGKKARCPNCRTVFFLTAPPDEDEVELQLADAPDQPQTGVGGHWVPDHAASPPGPQPAGPSSTELQPPDLLAHPPAAQSSIHVAAEDAGGAAHLKSIRKKTARRRNVALLSGCLTACALGTVIYAAQSYNAKKTRELAQQALPKRDAETVAEKENLKTAATVANASSPTSGDRLKLNGLPLGARFLISLKPSEIWVAGSHGEEVRYCLTPLVKWAEEMIKSYTNRTPAEIEHIIFAVIPGVVGEPPQTAAVFRFVEQQSKAKLILEFEAAASDDFDYKVYIGEERAYSIIDLHTVSVCPVSLAAEMASGIQIPNPQDDGIDALVQETDADRHLTVIFDPRNAIRHRDTTFPEVTWPLVDHFARFFNDEEIETVLWSFHLGDSQFFSEILMRNRTIIKEHSLVKEMRKKLSVAPYDIWHMVEKMDPQQIGRRRLIGRFPAMTQVFARSTVSAVGMTDDGRPNRYAQLVTSIDERAAPNLALGALLTWDESTRTDFSRTTEHKPQTSGTELPALVADRLKLKIDVEFNRTPLQEAFAFIAEECKTAVTIDGDALKDKGYTKNMPQTFVMTSTGLEVIKTIVGNYDSMCLVVQEDQKNFLITTESFAKAKGQTVFPLE